jgi:hypothetical protein
MRRTICAFVAALLAAVFLASSVAYASGSGGRDAGGRIGVNGVREAR